ncbi:MAG: DNA mismatch repair endonuclease MutL [Planctomycetota bacterium]|nr:MAG: DNA mismatch repair endonuclease MutL [Planctomycetota bacterium]
MGHAEPPLIRQLDERIANQIAAGEVVERPAAVVKELVENSLDAGARRIQVAIEDGGRQLIEVVDDGHGMRRDDLALALDRHATSKLRSAEDLFRIHTLGFRGEALPSIASVSDFTLASTPAAPAGAGGFALRVDGGSMQAVEPCAQAPGTRVSVRNLFWNVPARLKFLKTARAEGGAVSDTLTRLCLGHPQVGFTLRLDGQVSLDLPPGQTLRERVGEVLGAGLAKGLLEVEGLAESTQLSGFIAHPQHAKPSTKRQFVYLNGRPLADRMVVAAIREGFAGFLEPRLHGVVLLFLDTDPSLVDVNVHPTKAEVRFRRQGEVFALIRDSVHKALEASRGGFALAGPPGGGGGDAWAGVRRTVVRPAAPSIPPAPPSFQERFLPREPDTLAKQLAEDQRPAPRRVAEGEVGGQGELAGQEEVARMPAAAAEPGPALSSSPDLPGIRQVVQVGDMYVLVETDQGIRLIDQHALHEKALYLCLDPAVREFERGGRQELLIPQTIDLEAAEMAVVEPHLPSLAAVGIEAEIFGPSQLLLRAYPQVLRRVRWQSFFAELAAEKPGPGAVERLRERLAHRRACTSAVKAGQRLGREEMLELVRLLYSLEHMEHCPHGRPTTLDLSWEELERRFQR